MFSEPYLLAICIPSVISCLSVTHDVISTSSMHELLSKCMSRETISVLCQNNCNAWVRDSHMAVMTELPNEITSQKDKWTISHIFKDNCLLKLWSSVTGKMNQTSDELPMTGDTGRLTVISQYIVGTKISVEQIKCRTSKWKSEEERNHGNNSVSFPGCSQCLGCFMRKFKLYDHLKLRWRRKKFSLKNCSWTVQAIF